MRKIFVSLVLGILFMQGCAVSGGQPGERACRTQLYGTGWKLVMFDNDAIVSKHPPTLKISDDGSRIGGFSGCNSYFGTVTLTDSEIRFPEALGSTRKFCRGEGGELERRLFAFFKGTKWWQFDEEGHLVIFDDEHRLVFAKIAS
jgi:heat shock protein HslJ